MSRNDHCLLVFLLLSFFHCLSIGQVSRRSSSRNPPLPKGSLFSLFVCLFVSFLLLASALVSYGEVVTFTPHLQLVVLFLELHCHPSHKKACPRLSLSKSLPSCIFFTVIVHLSIIFVRATTLIPHPVRKMVPAHPSVERIKRKTFVYLPACYLDSHTQPVN